MLIVSLGPSAYPREDATHIYDGLTSGLGPTHVAHMRLGSFLTEPTPWPLNNMTLYDTALQWLKEDREHRRELEGRGRKSRGARGIVRGDLLTLSHLLTNSLRAFQPIRRFSTRSEYPIFCCGTFDADVCFQI